jgi:hypothetical protein
MVDVRRFSSWGSVRIFLRDKLVYLMPVLLIVCLGLAISNAGAAYTTPSKVPIQGRLTNVSTGAALSGSYNFTFRVYNASTGGTKLWEENQSLTVDSGGLWSAFLGNNTPLDLNFSEDTYIEIEINHDEDPLPRVQLATVPYSKRTDIAANLSCVDCIGGTEINESSLVGLNASSFNGQTSSYFLNISTSFGGDVSGSYGSMKVNASKIDTGILNRSYIEDSYLLNTGDNATGNYSFDSDTLYVDSTNHRIGIGTNTPTYKLEVVGGVNATGNLTTPLVCLNGDCRSTWPTGSGISSAGGWANTSTETYSSLDVNLSNKFFFNSSTGYVGIGTMSPLAALSVGSASQFQVSSTGAVTVASINGNNITAGTGTLTLGAGKTFNASNTLTLTATDGSILAIGSGGTLGTGAYATIGNYAPLASPTFTGTVTMPSPFTLGATSVTANGTELNYVVGVTSAIQTQLNAKAPTASPTFTGSVIMPGTGIWNTSGNVGIGTTDPLSRLSVVGDMNVSSLKTSVSSNSAYALSTIISAQDFNHSSSVFWGSKAGDLTLRAGWIKKDVSNGYGISMTYTGGNLYLGAGSAEGVNELGKVYGDIYFRRYADGSSTDLAIIKGQSGNVGIGTTNPATLLSVMKADGSGNPSILVGNDATGAASKYGEFYYSDTGDFVGISGGWTGHTRDIVLQENGGNVGIGTTSPAYSLDVIGTLRADARLDSSLVGTGASTTPLIIISSNAANTDSVNLQFEVGNGHSRIRGYRPQGSYGELFFETSTNAGASFSTGMVLKTSGNVGIGTTVPVGLLALAHNVVGEVPQLTFRGDDQLGAIRFYREGSRASFPNSYAEIRGLYGSGDARRTILTFTTSDAGDASERMRILANGNVGIGTTSPGYQLTLSTNSAAKPTSDHWTISSDARLKEDITEIPNALQTVLQLEGREFGYIDKEQYGASRQYGFIAQDVEAVVPRWVQTGVDGYKTLTIAGDTALLVEAIKEQQGAIQDQQKQMDKLKAEKDADIKALRAEKDSEIKELNEENDALKALVCLDHPDAEVCRGISGI